MHPNLLFDILKTIELILLSTATSSQGARTWTVNFGGQEVKGQGHTRLKIDLVEASFSTSLGEVAVLVELNLWFNVLLEWSLPDLCLLQPVLTTFSHPFGCRPVVNCLWSIKTKSIIQCIVFQDPYNIHIQSIATTLCVIPGHCIIQTWAQLWVLKLQLHSIIINYYS